MSREAKTVWVRVIAGELMRFHVESWEDPAHPHLVDLLDRRGNGGCDCWDYRKTCSDNQKKVPDWPVAYRSPRDGKINPLRTQCRHIDAATRYMVPRIFRRMADDEHAKNKG